MRALLLALLLVPACTADNPDLAPWPLPCEGGSCPPRRWPDLASETCGLVGDPCCRDVHGREFCTAGACYDGRCGVPDLAPPPDLVPAGPDMAWRPDLTGGQCVGRCGACTTSRDCCISGEWQANCLHPKTGRLVQPGEIGICTPGGGCVP